VLAGAVRLADTHGLPAVTMRRLAADLGVEAMSLYHHVPSKDALLDGLVEAVVGEVQAEVAASGEPEGWRARLRDRCLSARRVMLRHPWAPALISSRPSVPPTAYLHYEAILTTLVDGGFSYHLAHRALHALGSMALGFVQEVFSPVPSADAPGTDPGAADLARMADALPHLVAMAESEAHDAGDPVLGWCDSQAEFEFTLDLLLDGLDRARVLTT